MGPQTSTKVSPENLKSAKGCADLMHEAHIPASWNTILEFIRLEIRRSFAGSARSIIKAARWTADHPRVVFRRLGTVSISIVCACTVLLITVQINENLHPVRRSIVTLSLVLAVLAIANRWGRLESFAAALVGALVSAFFFRSLSGILLSTPKD